MDGGFDTVKNRRTALWTVDRASQGASRHESRNSESIILIGSAIVRKPNRMHVLHAKEPYETIEPTCIYDIPSEDWCHEVLRESDEGCGATLVSATRKGLGSFVSIWTLPDFQSRNDDNTVSAKTLCSIELEKGQIFKVVNNNNSTLAITDCSLCLMGTTASSSLSVVQSLYSTTKSDGVIADGGWVDANTAFLITGKQLRTVDKRSGKVERTMHVEEKMSNGNCLVPRYAPTLSSACHSAANNNHMIYVGGDTGELYAFDIAQEGSNAMLWCNEQAHRHSVSKLICTPRGRTILSGGVDGVVRCWTKEGQCMATYPQHDDTITNILSWTNDSFLSISYDGRVALASAPFTS